jgi:hypothetical protein
VSPLKRMYAVNGVQVTMYRDGEILATAEYANATLHVLTDVVNGINIDVEAVRLYHVMFPNLAKHADVARTSIDALSL